jgi:hypothetical protein
MQCTLEETICVLTQTPRGNFAYFSDVDAKVQIYKF